MKNNEWITELKNVKNPLMQTSRIWEVKKKKPSFMLAEFSEGQKSRNGLNLA